MYIAKFNFSGVRFNF